MADQATSAAKGPTATTKEVPGAGAAQEKAKGAASGILGRIESIGSSIATAGRNVLNRVFPPEQRASVLAKIQAFMLKNPKLSTFLGMNIALTGIPLFLFGLFSLVVFVTALVIALVVALLAAVAFTLVAVGIALTVLLPTILFTTGSACFLFLWGLGGYYLLKWMNDPDQEGGGSPPIGEMLNNITGGRLGGFMDAAKKEQSKSSIEGFGDKFNPPAGGGAQEDGKPAGQQKQSGNTTAKPTSNSGAENATGKAANSTGAAKAAGAGATGST